MATDAWLLLLLVVVVVVGAVHVVSRRRSCVLVMFAFKKMHVTTSVCPFTAGLCEHLHTRAGFCHVSNTMPEVKVAYGSIISNDMRWDTPEPSISKFQ